MSKNKFDWVVISYVPLMTDVGMIDSRSANMTEQVEMVAKRVMDAPNATGIVWAQNEEGNMSLYFTIENARAIYDHLMAWTEGDPTSWFKLVLFKQNKQQYRALLMPEVKKSVDRFFRERAPANMKRDDSKIRILFSPLDVDPGLSKNALSILNRPPKKMVVGLIDADFVRTINPRVPSPIDENEQFTIGTLEVSTKNPYAS